MRSLIMVLVIGFCFAATAADKTSRLDFHIVHNEPLKAGRLVDTKEFPKLGYIATNPNLSIKHLKAASKAKATTALLTLHERDAKALAALTARCVGRRLLLTLNGRPLMAPTVREPIRAGQLAISIRDEKQMKQLLPVLRKLANER